MKRLHVHVAVDDLSQAVKFYSTLFAAEPNVTKPDYAKWMLDDPRVNFAISMRGAQTGLNHLGIQVDSQAVLHEVYGRRRRGLTILRAFRGRHSSPRERIRFTVTAQENAAGKHVTPRKRIPSPNHRLRLPHLVAERRQRKT